MVQTGVLVLLPVFLALAGFSSPAPLAAHARIAQTQAAAIEGEDAEEDEEEKELERVRIVYERGQGLRWTTAHDRFSLRLGLFTQLLYQLEHELEDADTGHTIEIRRARVDLHGHTFGPHNRFEVQLAFSPQDLEVEDGRPTKTPIFDWVLELDHLSDLVVRAGQYRVPWSRQRRIPFQHIMMVDRALANFEFNLDRDIGVWLSSDDFQRMGWLRYDAGVSIGEGRDAYDPRDPGMLYVGRLEVLPVGMFDDYDETDHGRSARPRVSLGGAYAYLGRAKGNRGIVGPPPSDGGTTDTHNVTADVMLKVSGVTFLGEAYWRRGTRRYGDGMELDPVLGLVPAPREPARNGWGWFGQLGWLVPRIPLELGVRYGFVRPQGLRSSLPPRDEAAASVGWQLHGSNLKLVANYTRAWPQGSLPAGGTHESRVQLQAAF